MKTLSRQSDPRSRGQVMVLGCVALTVVALMLMISFNVTNAVHERIRIQSASDSQAYSLATVQARAFNTTAYYNRAIAAALVAQMSLHSWMSIATHDVNMLVSGVGILGIIAGIEAAMGCYPYNISHCPCVIAALISAFKMFKAAKKWSNTLKGLESQFNKGVEQLKKMVDSLHKAQVQALKRTRIEMMAGSVLMALKSNNAGSSSYVMALAPMNRDAFTCTLEGTDMDSCADRKSSLTERSKIIQNTANATRQIFNRLGISSSILSHANFRGPMGADVPKNALKAGNWGHVFTTRARVGDNTSSGSNKNAQAKNVGAGSGPFPPIGVATIYGFKHVPIMALPFNGEIFSGSPNKHGTFTLVNPHSGTHNKFEGVQQQEPCTDQNCFVNFNSLNDKDKDFGQPTVYGGVTQNLRLFSNKDGSQMKDKAPWEINDTGKIKIEMVSGKPATINMVPRGTGVAVSKAKVYFHQLGNWKVAPNFFDPFWRAKLHYFKTKDELQTVLTRAADTDGLMILNGGGPVEGQDL